MGLSDRMAARLRPAEDRSWPRRIVGSLPGWELTAGRITLVYLLFGTLALYVSDVLLVRYLSDPLLSQVQAAKAGAEILATGGLIYLLTQHSRRQLEATNEELELQRDEVALLYRLFRHNFRNDINVILGKAELARTVASDDEAAAHCRKIVDTVEDMRRYTDRIGRVRRVSETKDERYVFDIGELLRSILETHPRITADVDVTTTVPDGVQVRANALLEEALFELIDNAIEHNDAERPRLTIDVSAANAGTVHITITDNGIGIPTAEIEALEGRRETQLTHGAGLGLWLVGWVVRHSEGDLDVRQTGDAGTAVHLDLPAAGDAPDGVGPADPSPGRQ